MGVVELFVPPAVAKCDTEFFEPVEKLREFLVAEAAAGDALINDEDAEQHFTVMNGERDNAAESGEFLADFSRGAGLGRVGAEDACVLVKVVTDAVGKAERKFLNQSRLVSDGLSGAQPVVVGRWSAVRSERAGFAEEDGCAIDAEGFAKLLECSAEKFARIEAVD